MQLLGGAKSSVAVVDDTLNNLFDDVSGAEHAPETNYRCIFVKNDSAETAGVKVYIETNTGAADDTINIGKDLSAPSDTADTIADESTAQILLLLQPMAMQTLLILAH